MLRNYFRIALRSLRLRPGYGAQQIAREKGRSAKRFEEDDFVFADAAFFDVSRFAFRHGDPSTTLSQPGAVVLTPEAARRYFGDTDPMGKTLLRENVSMREESQVLTVTGVLDPLPANSHLQFDFVASMGLVVFQFAVSVVLIVATAVAYSQFEYLRTARLGFNQEQVGALLIARLTASVHALRAARTDPARAPRSE